MLDVGGVEIESLETGRACVRQRLVQDRVVNVILSEIKDIYLQRA